MNPWTFVDRLADDATDLDALRRHGLHLVAARRWRETGRQLPAALIEDERAAAITSVATKALLYRIRTRVDGPLVVLKGPEVAALYPAPALRPSDDIDLLVPDADAVVRALIEIGFRPQQPDEDFADHHHRPPLVLEGHPLAVEIHDTPGWLAWMTPPSAECLIADAIPSATGVDGLLTLRRDHHALLLAVHQWIHHPLRRLRDLVDVTAMADGLDAQHMDALARRWRAERVWSTTRLVSAALQAKQANDPLPLSLWARHLRSGREQSVIEGFVERWASDFWVQSPAGAARTAFRRLRGDLACRPGEGRLGQLQRIGDAVLDVTRPMSEHQARAE